MICPRLCENLLELLLYSRQTLLDSLCLATERTSQLMLLIFDGIDGGPTLSAPTASLEQREQLWALEGLVFGG